MKRRAGVKQARCNSDISYILTSMKLKYLLYILFISSFSDVKCITMQRNSRIRPRSHSVIDKRERRHDSLVRLGKAPTSGTSAKISRKGLKDASHQVLEHSKNKTQETVPTGDDPARINEVGNNSTNSYESRSETKVLPGTQGVIMNIYSGEASPSAKVLNTQDASSESSKLVNVLSHMERDEHTDTRHEEDEKDLEANKEDNEAEQETHNVLDMLTKEKEEWEKEDQEVNKKLDAEERKEEAEAEAIETGDKTLMDKSDLKAQEIRNKMHTIEKDMKKKEELIKDDEREMKEIENDEALKINEIKEDEKEKLDELKEIGEVEEDSEELQHHIESNKRSELATNLPTGSASIANRNDLTTNMNNQLSDAKEDDRLNTPQTVPGPNLTTDQFTPPSNLKPCEALSFISKKKIFANVRNHQRLAKRKRNISQREIRNFPELSQQR